MKEEREAILRMLAEGKITPEEAASLLDALDGPGPEAARGAGQRAGAGSGWIDGITDFAGRMASWGAEFGARVSEEIREGRVPALRWLSECFDGRETVTERAGGFDQDEVEVACSCEAGSFSLRGGTERGFSVSVRQRFGAEGGPAIEADGGRLHVRGNGIVRAEIVLPRTRRYRLNLRSNAGRLEIEGLSVTGGRLSTDAGSVRARDVEACSLSIESAAGAVDLSGLAAGDLRVRTNCGRIHHRPAPGAGGSHRLETDLGAINVIVPVASGLGCRLRAEAGLGSISCGPGFAVLEETRAVGRGFLSAESPGFAASTRRLELELRTNCGSIRVGEGAGA